MLARIVGAVAVAMVLTLLMLYLWTALTGWHKDNLGGPFIGLCACLTILLAVGVYGITTHNAIRGERQ